ncbi:COG4223 family protein [Aureimonas jatrophae]|uniref:Inner membrane protein n=1 Tax=Aureimonas jatrophae TaxID=1166073 RepID=A0A1H0KWP7_9HYPH|nr:hypothetical protein [Aureimonas jatrophae]MBB3948907.1 hypothetical protein [Aureimonas jatrophae]SDO60160.1 hypothetical protein SAMN05192530_108180 [Aureimonas jatrophae]
MANRPRRPSGGKPQTVIDGEAERVTPATVDGGLADETVLAQSGEPPSVFGGDESRRDGDPDVFVEPPAERPDDQPALVEVPATTPEDADPVLHTPVPPVGSRDDGSDRSAVPGRAEAEFAREEGLVPEAVLAGGGTMADAAAPTPSASEALHPDTVAEPTPRRDLGEFEDDEIVSDASREAEPPPAAPYVAPHESETRGPSFGSLLGAGLLGALIVGASGAALLSTGVVTLPDRNAQAINPQQFAAAGELQQARGDLQTLRETVEQLQSAQAAGGAGSGVAPADFTALTDRVTAAERAIQSGGTSSSDASNAAQGASQAAGAAQSTADQAREAANAAQAAADAARNTAGEAQGTAQAATQTAQGAVDTARSASEAANAAQQAVEAVRGEVQSFGERLAAIEDGNRRAAIALSAAGLKAAIDRGQPFMGELERFASSGGEGEGQTVDALRQYAAAGVPTPAALASQWSDAETAILDAVRPPVSASDVGDQVLSGLRSLVTVRPAGSSVSPSDPGPGATVARMDAALSSGDFAGWLTQWETLPEAAKTASSDFAAKVRARVETDRLIDQTINSAIGAPASQG